MGLSFYYILRSQTPPLRATQLDIIQTATIWYQEQGNIKRLSEKIIEFEKNIIFCYKIL